MYVDFISVKTQLVEGLVIINSANLLSFPNYKLKPRVFIESLFKCKLLMGKL